MKKNYQKLFSYLFTAAHLQLLVCATGNSCLPHGNGNTRKLFCLLESRTGVCVSACVGRGEGI